MTLRECIFFALLLVAADLFPPIFSFSALKENTANNVCGGPILAGGDALYSMASGRYTANTPPRNWLDGVACSSVEQVSGINACNKNTIGSHNCGHGEDVNLRWVCA